MSCSFKGKKPKYSLHGKSRPRLETQQEEMGAALRNLEIWTHGCLLLGSSCTDTGSMAERARLTTMRETSKSHKQKAMFPFWFSCLWFREWEEWLRLQNVLTLWTFSSYSSHFRMMHLSLINQQSVWIWRQSIFGKFPNWMMLLIPPKPSSWGVDGILLRTWVGVGGGMEMRRWRRPTRIWVKDYRRKMPWDLPMGCQRPTGQELKTRRISNSSHILCLIQELNCS